MKQYCTSIIYIYKYLFIILNMINIIFLPRSLFLYCHKIRPRESILRSAYYTLRAKLFVIYYYIILYRVIRITFYKSCANYVTQRCVHILIILYTIIILQNNIVYCRVCQITVIKTFYPCHYFKNYFNSRV